MTRTPPEPPKKILTALKEEQICRLPVTKARFHCGLNCFADKKGKDRGCGNVVAGDLSAATFWDAADALSGSDATVLTAIKNRNKLCWQDGELCKHQIREEMKARGSPLGGSLPAATLGLFFRCRSQSSPRWMTSTWELNLVTFFWFGGSLFLRRFEWGGGVRQKPPQREYIHSYSGYFLCVQTTVGLRRAKSITLKRADSKD